MNLSANEKEFLGCFSSSSDLPDREVYLVYYIEEARVVCEKAKSASRDQLYDWTQVDNGPLVIDALTMACAERDRYREMLKGVEPLDMADPEEYKDGVRPTTLRCFPG